MNAIRVKHVEGTEPTKYVVERRGVVVSMPAPWDEAISEAMWRARISNLTGPVIPPTATAEMIAAEAWEGFNADCD